MKHQSTPEAPVPPASPCWPISSCGLPALEPHSLPPHQGQGADPPETQGLLSIPFAVWLPFCSVDSPAAFGSSLLLPNLPRKSSCPDKPLMRWVRSRFIISYLSAEEQRQKEKHLCVEVMQRACGEVRNRRQVSSASVQDLHVAFQQVFHLQCFEVGASCQHGDSTRLCNLKKDIESGNTKVK